MGNRFRNSNGNRGKDVIKSRSGYGIRRDNALIIVTTKWLKFGVLYLSCCCYWFFGVVIGPYFWENQQVALNLEPWSESCGKLLQM